MTNKLRITGPYRADHPGPFCTADGRPARVLCRDWQTLNTPVIALVKDSTGESLVRYSAEGVYAHGENWRLMCAEEAPAPREIWLNIYPYGEEFRHNSRKSADDRATDDRIKCIHFREVMEGE
ncbi:hypothetical protein AAC691_15430 [Nguyenibacter vanlangensis]|uniref:Uncharacterized protein n=1 Tax=Nguyenibacter vanlangensis TaxID=1216886 RepID=A0ABZ3D265_9PROT